MTLTMMTAMWLINKASMDEFPGEIASQLKDYLISAELYVKLNELSIKERSNVQVLIH